MEYLWDILGLEWNIDPPVSSNMASAAVSEKNMGILPSGKLSHNYGKSPFCLPEGISTRTSSL